VKQGWQSVFRSRSIAGPYEGRIVLAQGASDVNGPHQGALVDTAAGASWFIHFQDLDAYGRVVHLQPVAWRAGWPVIGRDDDGDGTGEPVGSFLKPAVGRVYPIATPQASDEFTSASLGPQWQWQANPVAAWSSLTSGRLRLAAMPARGANLWSAPHLLLQKLPAPVFTATASLEFTAAAEGARAGLLVFGADYAWVGVRNTRNGMRIVTATARAASNGAPETETASIPLDRRILYVRATVSAGAVVQFSYSLDNGTFAAIGEPFTAKPGRWVGAKVGLFAEDGAGGGGAALFDWFRIADRD
jgi:beta-xylosidase